MFRLAALAFCLTTVVATVAPANALNPQPLPPGPCKCDSYLTWSYKHRLQLRMLVLKQRLQLSRIALVR